MTIRLLKSLLLIGFLILSGCTSTKQKLKPFKCHSVGHLLTHTRAKVQIFGSYSYDEDGTIEVGTIETMPGSWVLEVKKI